MYRASDGYPLLYRHWRPRASPRAVVVALHGIQSHGGWYQHSSQRLAESGYEVYFLDRRGSGLNFQSRGHAPHEERLIADVRQFVRQLQWERRDQPPCPLVLLGVSWGGKLATACAAAFPQDIDGLALLYPGLFSQIKPTRWQEFRLARAQAVGWGQVTVPIPLNAPDLFTDSPRWQEFIRRDELALQRVSIDFMHANLRLTRSLPAAAERIRCPVLMLLAGRDRIIDNAANRAFLQRLTHVPTQLIEYPQACHTLEFEPDPEPFIADVLTWLNGISLPDAGRTASA